MSSEWPTKRLADISEVITGFPFKSENYLPPKHGVRVVRGDNVTERYVRWGEKEKCWSDITDDLKPYALRSGDVVIGMDGSKVGKNFAAISPNDEGSLLAQRVSRVRAQEGVSQDYLRYVICNDSFTQYVQAVHTGTSIPHISKGQIENFEVVVPPLEDQLRIATALISIDDRITLLRETNATLEAIAQALFKSWFVDFDPVRAKMEGRTPEGMDEATAALFPDGFEPSELRDVPRGWGIGSVYDISKVIYGAPFASKLFKAASPGRPLVRIRDLKDERPGIFTEEIHPKGYLLKPGDIAVGMDGEFRAYVWGARPLGSTSECACSTRLTAPVRLSCVSALRHCWQQSRHRKLQQQLFILARTILTASESSCLLLLCFTHLQALLSRCTRDWC